MNVIAPRISRFLKSVNWPFLIFLIGVTNVKLQLKILFIIFYCCYFLYRKIPFKGMTRGPVKFYLLMPVIGIIGAFFTGAFHIHGYWFGYIMSAVIWVMCATSFVLIASTVDYLPRDKQRSTIELFFILNAIVSIGQIVAMAIVCKHIFPYWYNDRLAIYGVSTGDHLQGIFQDTSTINAAINVCALFYFLFLKKYKYVLLCLVICLLCTSNLTMMAFMLLIGFIFLFFRKERKAAAVVSIVAIGLYLCVSPENVTYTKKMLNKVFAWSKQPETHAHVAVTPEAVAVVSVKKDTVQQSKGVATVVVVERKVPKAIVFTEDSVLNDFSGPVLASLGSASLDSSERAPVDTGSLRNVMSKWYGVPYDATPLAVAPQPGKVLALKQVLSFLRSGKKQLLFGAGPGNFSSKLAIKMTGFKLQGNYPQRYRYMNELYFKNHFYVYMYFLAKPVSERSTINSTGSVYNQLGGEYGLLGLLSFAIFYIGYFFRTAMTDKRKLVFILALLLFFFFEYWFELLTLTIFFELFMLSSTGTDKDETLIENTAGTA